MWIFRVRGGGQARSLVGTLDFTSLLPNEGQEPGILQLLTCEGEENEFEIGGHAWADI